MSRNGSRRVRRLLALLGLGYILSAAGCWAVAAGAGAGVGYAVGHEAGEDHDHHDDDTRDDHDH